MSKTLAVSGRRFCFSGWRKLRSSGLGSESSRAQQVLAGPLDERLLVVVSPTGVLDEVEGLPPRAGCGGVVAQSVVDESGAFEFFVNMNVSLGLIVRL